METPEFQNIENKIYDFQTAPQIPKSLNRYKAKEIMMDANNRAKNLYRGLLAQFLADHNIEPLLIETIAYDLVFIDYGYSENLFRYAAHKYELKKDPEIKEFLDHFY